MRLLATGMFLILLTFCLSSSAAGVSLEFSGISEGQAVAGIQTLKLNVRASGKERVKDVKFYLGNDLIYQTEYAPYLFLWDTTEVSDGTYNLKALVETNEGIQEKQILIKVENHPTPSGTTQFYWDFEEEPKGWGGDPDLSVELVRGAGLQGNYAAKYSGAYKFTTICKSNTRWGTHSGMAFDEIFANKKYYIEAWVKIDKIDSDYFDIADLSIKLNAMIRDEEGKGVQKVYSTMKYDFAKMGTWQKLCMEFETQPAAAFFYLRLETIGPDVLNPEKTIDIEMYLDEIKVIQI
jgi:hypothetical protein